jgi:hypothetical protein
VDGGVAVGDDLHALGDEAIDHAVHLPLVAGNGARGEDHEITAIELDVGMFAIGDAGHGGAGLALAAGGQQHDLVARKA